MAQAQYDSREHFEIGSYHKLGVVASAPFLLGGRLGPGVDISRETVRVGTVTYAGMQPADSVARDVRTATEATIAELDAAITELTEHRNRLTAELGRLDRHTWITAIAED